MFNVKNWTPTVPSLVGLFAGIALTVSLWLFAEELANRDKRVAFDERVQHATLAVNRVVDELTGLTNTIRSLLETNPALTREDFNRSMLSRNQRLFASGLQFVGLLQVRGRSEGAGCARKIGDANCLQFAKLYPSATNQSLFELDASRWPNRAEAIDRAIDFGYVAVTRPLQSAPDSTAFPGLIVYLPIYDQAMPLVSVGDRRNALLGLALASFSLEDTVRTELGRDFFSTIAFRILDVGLAGGGSGAQGASEIVFDGLSLVRQDGSAGFEPVTPHLDALTRRIPREFAGRRWILEFAQYPISVSGRAVTTPRLVVGLGSLLSVLLYLLLQSLAGGRKRAEALAGQMTLSLHRREAQLHQALDAARMGSWQWEAKDQSFSFDERAGSLLGLKDGPLSLLLSRIHKQDRRGVQNALKVAAAEGQPFSAECRLSSRIDGVAWVELSARLVHDARGQVASVSGLVRDVTERNELNIARRRLLHRLVNAEEKERRRIARELHDQLGQEISAIILGLRNLESLSSASAEHRVLLGRMNQIVHDIDSKVDKFMLDLRPVVLDDLGLEAALKTQLEQWSALHAIEVNSHISGLSNVELPFELATTVFRLVQEALTNVAKHSGATAVDVIVELSSAHLQVVVEDNGRGGPLATPPHSYGLAGMQERVDALDGEFRYESSVGKGFSVFARLPMTRTALTAWEVA